MKKIPLSILSVFGFLLFCVSAHAADLYWSANGTGLGGVGAWNTTTANRFGTSSSGPFNLTWNNANVDSAIFSTNFAGGSPAIGAITPTTVTVNKIIITNSTTSPAYSFAGSSTITFSGDDAGIFLSGANNGNGTTNSVAITCKVDGPVVTKTGGGRINLNNTGNTVGRWIVNGGAIAGTANSTSAANALFGTGNPATLVTNFITLNGGGFGFTGASPGNFSLGANRGIYLGASGGQIGSGSSTAEITIDSPITGPGDLHFPGVTEWPGEAPGDNGIFIISNTNNNYLGQTRIATAEIRLGNNQVFPATTTINIVNGSINGRLNLNGFNQTVAKVILDSTSGNSRIIDTVGTGSLTADEFELRRSGYAGVQVGAVLTGSGFLRKTTTGAIVMGSVNTYTGDTRIEQGTLTLTNSGSFDSSANISITAGATLKVTNRVDAKLTLGSAQTLTGSGTVVGAVAVNGTISPGTNGFVGKLNVGTNTWNGGGKYKWEINKATGAAGTNAGWDQVNITGDLTIAATSENPFTIYITSLTLASAPGAVSDFNNLTEYSWSIAKTTTGITGFDTNAFVLNTNGFVNSLGAAGVFRITTNATDILLLFTLEPVNQTITFDPQSDRAYGDSFDPGATASSGLPVSYSIVSGPATVLDNVVTVTGLGDITVLASQAGDVSYLAAESVEQTFTANPASLLVAADNLSRAYGSANPTLTINYTGFKLGETLGTSDLTGSAELSTLAEDSSVPGEYAISIAPGNLSSTHYSLSFADGTLTVTQAVLTVTAENKSREFNTANPAFTYTITGFVLGQDETVVTGDPDLSTTAVIESNPGEYPIQVAAGNLAADNYQFSLVNGTLTIVGFPLTVTAVNTNRVYGEANPTFTVTYSGFVDEDDESVISGSPAFSTSAGTNSSVTGSPYSITPSIGNLTAARYSFTTFVDGELTITKAPLTVTALNASKAYGSTNPTFDASYSGFANGETAAVLSGSPLLETAATTNSTVAGGPYEITAAPGTLAADNYSFDSFVSGQLTVTQALLTVTADDKMRLPGQENPTLTGVIVGIQNGDDISATYDTDATVESLEGTYEIVPTLVDVDEKLENYSVTTNNGTLTILHDPSILTQPSSQTNVAESTVYFHVEAVGTDTLQYQWTKGGTNLIDEGNVSGVSSETLTLANISQSDAGTYAVVVTEGAEIVTSSNATLTVIDPVVITAQPGSRTNAYGTTATFTVAASGTAPITYQWKKNDVNLSNGGKISGATSSTLTITNVTPADVDSYSVVVSNWAGAVNSESASLTVVDPGIATQPLSRTNNVGDNARFTVVAGSSETLSYQWRYNDGDIPGATTNTLDIAVDSADKAGAYSVVVYNSIGTNISSDAALVVFYADRTKITQWNFNSVTPDNNTSTGTTTPSLGSGTVGAVGDITANQFNDGSSADPASLGTDNSSRRWNGLLQSVPNKTAGVRFSVSTLGRKNIAISGEQWNSTRGSAYWRKQYTTNGTDWVDRGLINLRNSVRNGTFLYFSDDLSGVPGIANNTNFQYRVLAEWESTATGSGANAYVAAEPPPETYNGNGLLGWDMVTVFGNPLTPPVIVSSPSNLATNAGETVVFTASATGAETVVWTKDGNPIGSGATVTEEGLTTSTLTLENVQVSDNGTYVAKFFNEDAPAGVSSASAILTVTKISQTIDFAALDGKTYGDAPFNVGATASSGLAVSYSILSGPATISGDQVTITGAGNVTVRASQAGNDIYAAALDVDQMFTVTAASLTVTVDNKTRASGEANPVFTGVINGIQNSDDITATYSTDADTGSPAGTYAIIPTLVDPDSKLGNYSVTTNHGTLTVLDAPVITTQPTNVATGFGTTAIFSVIATGSETLGYQWRHDATNITDGEVISGATSASLTLTGVSVPDEGDYDVVVTNYVGSVTSSIATLTLVGGVAITNQPDSVLTNVTQGASVTFEVGAEGGSLTYQWYYGAGLIIGATDSSYTIPSVQANHTTNGYIVIVSNPGGSVTSAPAATIAGIIIDANKPTVGVTTPKVGGGVGTSAVTLTGSVKDLSNGGLVANSGIITSVKYRYNPGNVLLAESETNTAALTDLTKGKWSFTSAPNQLSLLPGTNIVHVWAQDLAGNVSDNLSPFFVFYDVTNNLVLKINGTGTGTGVKVNGVIYNGPSTNVIVGQFKVGRLYTAETFVLAGNNSVFTNWTASPTNIGHSTNTWVQKSKLPFVMQPAMTLTATFNADPYPAVLGKYYGLFYESEGVTHETAGHIQVTVKKKAGYSGTMLFDGNKVKFSGKFNADGTVNTQVVRSSFNNKLPVQLAMGINFDSESIGGTVSNETWVSDLYANKQVFFKNLGPFDTTNAGSYTFQLPSDLIDEPNGPKGVSFAWLTNSPEGIMKYGGQMADGSKFTGKMNISREGALPFYVPLYKNVTPGPALNEYKGSVLGWLNFDDADFDGVNTLSWIKKNGSEYQAIYGAGFTNNVALVGSPYVPPLPLNLPITVNVLDRIIVTDGNLLQPVTNLVTVSALGKVKLAPLNTALFLNKAAISFKAKDGTFAGAFLDGLNKRITKGVVLQNTGAAAGHFVGTSESGTVILAPAE